MTNWNTIQHTLGITFQNLFLLQQALTHSSYINENQDLSLGDNERMEFLGDAFLNFIATEKLYQEFPDLSEGELTQLRTLLIRQETLAELAGELKLGDYLLLGKGEESSGGRERRTSLADAFEALVGAILLDQGPAIATEFLLSKLESRFQKIKAGDIGQNHKALLQEFTQSQYQQLPSYHVVEVSGPDHDRSFTVQITLNGKMIGTGSGKSKRTAEIEAARHAWESLKPD